MLLRLTEKQVQYLLKYGLKGADAHGPYSVEDPAPFLRCIGLLYVRFLSPPDQLLQRLCPYLIDLKTFHPVFNNTEITCSIGEFTEKLILD